MYLAMFALLRLFRRQAGTFSLADLLVVVVIADAAQNGMAGESKSVTESIILIVTIVGWDYLLNLLGFKSKVFEKIIEPQKLKVIENGKVLRENLRKELITTEELESQMRQNGIEDLAQVKLAYLESEGHFSFIKKDEDGDEQSNSKKKNAVG
jgi:uncharacterized membrane protein YcaP (DUF421 family)